MNATHEEYTAVEARVREFPQTRFVLDHCCYVSGSLAPSENTTAPVRALARYKNVYIKLTFLPLASRQAYPFADVHWIVRELVDAFGPDRCLFGSNFSTVQYSPQTEYEQTVALFADAVDLSVEERVDSRRYSANVVALVLIAAYLRCVRSPVRRWILVS